MKGIKHLKNLIIYKNRLSYTKLSYNSQIYTFINVLLDIVDFLLSTKFIKISTLFFKANTLKYKFYLVLNYYFSKLLFVYF